VIEDTTAPNAPTISTVNDDVAPVTGNLSSGARTNDTDLTVTVSLAGTNALAGDTVQLYNGTGIGSPVGSAHVLTAAEILAGSFSMQTGTLINGTTYDLTARITDAAGNQSAVSNTFTVIEDTAAPNAPTISTVNDDVAPVTGNLSSGARTNDTDLTVTVSLAGTNALAGDTVQLYNGTGIGSPVGSAHVLTAAEILAGSFSMQTGTLINGTTYDLTARITDAAGNQSAVSNTFTVIEDTTAPNAPTISTVNDDVAPVTGNLSSGARTNDTDLTVTVSLAGTNALAGDTVQLYNGTGIGSPVGSAHVLTAAEILAGSFQHADRDAD